MHYGMANNVDPDQTTADLGLHCLSRPVCPKIASLWYMMKETVYWSLFVHKSTVVFTYISLFDHSEWTCLYRSGFVE